MEIRPTQLPGCLEILPRKFQDERGSFVKTFHRDFFVEQGLVTNWQEEYYSVSNQNVMRGLHFQCPPDDHEKMVHCARGSALDVIVDLRRGSPTFGDHLAVELNAEDPRLIYIPKGMAHGFLALEDQTMMVYKVATIHSPESDQGVHWDSCGVSWPQPNPILSQRDQLLPSFSDFKSPFLFLP